LVQTMAAWLESVTSVLAAFNQGLASVYAVTLKAAASVIGKYPPPSTDSLKVQRCLPGWPTCVGGSFLQLETVHRQR
jgi:hypothetical protein